MLRLYYGHIRMLDDAQVFEKWFQSMDSVRQEKVLRCQRKEDQKRSLLAGVLLQKGLEQEDDKKRYYSISHSGEYVICAVSDRKIGVDIENRMHRAFLSNNAGQLEKIAKKCMTSKEYAHFLSVEETKRTDCMLYYWTRKESYSKAVGKGLAMDFSSIDTQKMDAFYWSDWVVPGYFCSLYVEDGIFTDRIMQEIVKI